MADLPPHPCSAVGFERLTRSRDPFVSGNPRVTKRSAMATAEIVGAACRGPERGAQSTSSPLSARPGCALTLPQAFAPVRRRSPLSTNGRRLDFANHARLALGTLGITNKSLALRIGRARFEEARRPLGRWVRSDDVTVQQEFALSSAASAGVTPGSLMSSAERRWRERATGSRARGRTHPSPAGS